MGVFVPNYLKKMTSLVFSWSGGLRLLSLSKLRITTKFLARANRANSRHWGGAPWALFWDLVTRGCDPVIFLFLAKSTVKGGGGADGPRSFS